jgi:uncharacterized protein (TIGR03067 family)
MGRPIPFLLCAAALSLGFAPAPLPKPDHGKADLEKMQGAWVLAYAIKQGCLREEPDQEAVWVIKGDVLTTSLGGKPGSTCYVTLDGRTTPRSIDLRNRRGEADPAPGRYSVDGDTLTVCIGEKRPRDLSGHGPSNGVWVMKRKKR